METLWAFEGLGDAAKDFVPELTEILKSWKQQEGREFNLSLGALRVLSQIGPAAQPALEWVRDIAESGNLSQRSIAYISLGAIGNTDSFNAVDFLTSKLQSFYQMEKLRT
ncbi:MAG: hypothetical protein R3C03_13725 [Pirellulaceae bacterium]